MITLYKFGPAFGQADASPFVMKAEILLKMAGLEFEVDLDGFNKAPKGKLPYIKDDGEIIADSTFIRLHIEKKYGFDFDEGLDACQRGVAWSVEKMLEDHLYWIGLHERWNIDDNFNRGPARFFDKMPAPLRPFIKSMVRRNVKRACYGQGISRHERSDIHKLGGRAIDALSNVLGGNDFLMGSNPCGADAFAYAIMATGTSPVFETPLIGQITSHDNLVAYRDRMAAKFFREVAQQ